MIWRPNRVSNCALVLLAVVSIVALAAVKRYTVKTRQPCYDEQMAAANRMEAAMNVIRNYQSSRSGQIDLGNDPTGSGLIGREFTEITSDAGDLEAKQTSINPNLAALVVRWLREADLQAGDTVAVGLSASFPAGNIAVLIACETLKLRPLVISSISGSMYGANLPNFTWLDIETLLVTNGILKTKSLAATLGAGQDIGYNLSARGRRLLISAISRNGVPPLNPENLQQSVQKRMELYRERAGEEPVRMYINVGGSLGSIGARTNSQSVGWGLRFKPRRKTHVMHGPMTLFAEQGIPVINLVQMKKLAAAYGLPVAPVTMPRVGEGDLFSVERHNLWLAGGALLSLSVLAFLLIRVDMGSYLTRMRKLYGMENDDD